MLVLSILAPILSIAALLFVYFREKRRFLNKIRDIQVPDSEGISEVSLFTGAVAKQFSACFMQSMKGTDMNNASQLSRKTKALEGAIAQDVMALDPKMAALLQVMPGVNKWVGKNPQLAGMLTQQLGGLMADKGAAAGSGNHNEPAASAFQI